MKIMITLFVNQPTYETIKNGKRCFWIDGYFKIQKKITKIDHRNLDLYTQYKTCTNYKTCTCTLRLTHTLPISPSLSLLLAMSSLCSVSSLLFSKCCSC